MALLSEIIDRIVFVPVIHVDTESVNAAREVVLKIKPDVVAVELDRARYHQLLSPQREQSTQPSFDGDTVSEMMNQIALLERNLGQLTGSMAGDEMLAAIQAGREIHAKIALVDRPIEATAQALMHVPLTEIYKLSEMIPGAASEVEEGGTSNLMEMLRDAKNVDDLMKEFRKEFPMLSNALIDQRDVYIAKALKSILSDVEGKIVVVLGSGHIDGVTNILKKLLEEDNAS